MTIELTCDTLRNYLSTLKPHQMAGIPGQSDSCPLAQCLKAQGHKDVIVTPWCIRADNKTTTPQAWMRSFIRLVDTTRARTVTARRANKILEEVCP